MGYIDFNTGDPLFRLRFATPDDAGLVLHYMRRLGDYQKMADKISATEAQLYGLLADGAGEAIFGEYDGEVVSFLYFYGNSSAFIGGKGLYIDAFFVDDAVRFKGIGKIMLSLLSRLALERGCARIELGCLDWNEPSIRFYKKLGAASVDAMSIYRFSADALATLSEAGGITDRASAIQLPG